MMMCENDNDVVREKRRMMCEKKKVIRINDRTILVELMNILVVR